MPHTPYMTAIDISASGLRAQRVRMNAIAENIANLNTTRTEEGGPYKRQLTVLTSKKASGAFEDYLRTAKVDLYTTHAVHLEPIKGEKADLGMHGVDATIELDKRPPKMIFDPTHPDANAQGYVAMPNINIVEKMVNMISASRSYEANVTAITSLKAMARSAMEI
jgi:flagellar basal-body rod protein FlgC